MADDKSKTRPQDALRVNVHEDYEVRYWTTRLNVTKIRFVQAVTKVGISVLAVRQEPAPL